MVNLSTEDDKLKADAVGLLNAENGGGITKLRLNLAEVPHFSVFEGECIVAEGYNDNNSRFNVNRLIKPECVKGTSSHYSESTLQKFYSQ